MLLNNTVSLSITSLIRIFTFLSFFHSQLLKRIFFQNVELILLIFVEPLLIFLISSHHTYTINNNENCILTFCFRLRHRSCMHYMLKLEIFLNKIQHDANGCDLNCWGVTWDMLVAFYRIGYIKSNGTISGIVYHLHCIIVGSKIISTFDW